MSTSDLTLQRSSSIGGGAAAIRRPPPGRAWKATKRFLYIFHRWTGIILCLFFAIWFLSGVVMMYVPFPSFRAAERVELAAPIDWARVHVDPAAALARLKPDAFPEEMRLDMTGGAPVYRFTTADGRRALSAETGQDIAPIDPARAGAIARALVNAPVQSVIPVDHDQWVVTRAYAKIAPFWRVRMADAAATDIYITRKSGEIVQNSTAHERFWNWLGAIPHWIYFTALRVYQEPWRQVVLWISGIGMLGGMAGIWIGLLRVRLSRRYRSGSVSPYRGWMKWHHIAGLIGGLFLMTWIFSGWMSMSPWGGFHDPDQGRIADLYAGARPDFPSLSPGRLAQEAPGAKEIRFSYIGGQPVAMALDGQGHKRRLDGPIAPAQIAAIARGALPSAHLVATQWLDRYDLYWYSSGDPRRDGRPLPVLRLIFDDPSQTWLHIDPATGELLGQSGKGSRTDRWLFNALHSFDLPWLLMWRPLRDALMWLLSAAGLAISVSGIVIGWRRLRRPKAS